MKITTLYQLLLGASSVNKELSGTSAPAASLVEQPQIAYGQIDESLNATAWSLIYTYPLYIFANWAGNVLRTVPVNTILHQRDLASPESPGVIKPNVDTLYSRVILDLSQNDAVLTIPNVTELHRYFVYPVIDLYGNIVAEIGSVNANKPGKYLIRRADNAAYQHDPQSSDEYQGIIDMPTYYGTMLIRYLLLANTTEDVNAVHSYQNASDLTTIPRQTTSVPALASLAPNGTFLGVDTPAKLLSLAAKLTLLNPPPIDSERIRVSTSLAAAGILNGQYIQPSGVNLTLASEIANTSIAEDIANPTNIRFQTNGWQLAKISYQAQYGMNYGARAYVAIFGYQQQTVRQTLYPGYRTLGFTSEVTLEPNTSYLLTFSGRPQLKKSGFWSYTVYGADQYLVPNALSRYEMGDRSFDLLYQDGSGPVYGPKANASHDGPFQVLVQNINSPPPANWTGNWIPSSDTFSYITRWYVPEDSMTNGSYIYPKVEIIPSIY